MNKIDKRKQTLSLSIPFPFFSAASVYQKRQACLSNKSTLMSLDDLDFSQIVNPLGSACLGRVSVPVANMPDNTMISESLQNLSEGIAKSIFNSSQMTNSYLDKILKATERSISLPGLNAVSTSSSQVHNLSTSITSTGLLSAIDEEFKRKRQQQELDDNELSLRQKVQFYLMTRSVWK